MDWIIYTLKCPRTQAVRYVGFTTRKPDIRFKAHISRAQAQTGKRTHKDNWVLSLLSVGLLPLMDIVERGAGPDWPEAEHRWFVHYRASGARLVNATEGGEGVPGRKATDQDRARISAQMKARMAAMTPEERRAFAARGRALITPEHRKAGWARLNAEARKARGKSIGRLTPKQRLAAGKKSWAVRSQALGVAALNPMRIGSANRTHEERSATAREMWARRTPEKLAAAKANMSAARLAIPPERLTALGKIAGHATMAAKSPEERHAFSVKAGAARAALTPEQHSAISKKAWITRRARAAAA